MKDELMTAETRSILAVIKRLQESRQSLGMGENVIENIMLGWWGEENSYRISMPSGYKFYDTIVIYFNSFRVRICKFATHVMSIDKNIIYADSLLEDHQTDCNVINKAVDAITEILETELSNFKFEKREFSSASNQVIRDDMVD